MFLNSYPEFSNFQQSQMFSNFHISTNSDILVSKHSRLHDQSRITFSNSNVYSIGFRRWRLLNTEDWVDRGWDRGPPPRSANRLTLWTDSAGLKFRGTVGQLCTGSQWGIVAGTGSRWFVGDHKGRHSARATCTSSHIIYAYLSCEEWEALLAGSNRLKERAR